jgi:hypothetical protein
MSDELAEKLKAHTAEQQRRKLIEIEHQKLQKSHDSFVCGYARYEYDDLVDLMKQKVEETRSKTGNSPELTLAGSYIQLGHVALYFQFDQPVVNRPDNQLVLRLGLAPNKHGPFGSGPTPVIHRLEAMEAHNREIIWVGKLGRFKSDELAKIALEMLVDYYCQHTTG